MSDALVPPNALEAEGAILGASLLDGGLLKRAKDCSLRPVHFYSDAGRIVFDALLTITGAGRPADILSVCAFLTERGTLKRIGGKRYLVELMDLVPSVDNIEEYCKIVIDRWKLRELIARCQSVAALAYTGTNNVSEFLSNSKAEFDRLTEDNSDGIEWATTDEILEPIPDPEWLCKGLQIGPGRPTCFVGGPGAGKTIIAQAIAMSVVAGCKSFGQFFTKGPGRVRHIDNDLGYSSTKRRYSRLAIGMGLTRERIGGRLELCKRGSLNLVASSDDVWLRHCQGIDLIILDALRGLLPGLDENSSEVQPHLSRLTTFSEKTGCSFLVIHHKAKGDANLKGGDLTEIMRGSTGIAAAVGSTWYVVGKRNDPKKLHHIKPHPDAGGIEDSFSVQIRDVDDGNYSRAGVHVGFVDDAEESTDKDLDERVQKVLSEYPGKSGRNLAALAKMNGTEVYAALARLEKLGLAEERKREGRGGGRAWFPKEAQP